MDKPVRVINTTESVASPFKGEWGVPRASGFGLRASGFGLRASGFGLRASGFGLRASGFGLRASG
ncbi:MAG: hypothetical protein LBQ31_00960, partial [Bacteroidales bacterium]|nr:hypothetical protein [Bacteroidales bacterium]